MNDDVVTKSMSSRFRHPLLFPVACATRFVESESDDGNAVLTVSCFDKQKSSVVIVALHFMYISNVVCICV